MNNDDLALKIIRRQQQIASNRSMFESQWFEINRFVLPSPDLFFRNNLPQGQKVAQYEFDSTATLCLRRYAAAIESVVTPRTTTWNTLAFQHQDLNQIPQVKEWLEDVNRISYNVRYSPAANFASQANEIYLSFGKYGNGCMFVEDSLDKVITYRSIHLAELYVAENHLGKVDTIYRRFFYTAAQAFDAWGDNLPDMVKQQIDINPDQQFEFIHFVEPNPDHVFYNRNSFAYNSTYVSITGSQIIEQGNYFEMPYCFSRYNKNTGEVYGRGPAMDALADIKMINVMSKTNLNAAQLAVNPPLLMPAKSVLSVFNLVPGALNPGALSIDGRPMVTPLQTGAQLNVGETMLEQRRSIVNTHFLNDLFQILVQTPEMTATEAMLRAQEKGDLLAPAMGRIQSELLGPMIVRELDILQRANLLPPLPDAVKEYYGISDDYENYPIHRHLKIDYVSPLNKAQRSSEGIAIMQLVNSAGSIAQFDQSVLQKINFSKCLELVGDITGVPPEVFFTDEEVQQKQAAQQQQAQMQDILQSAPIAAQTAKTLQEAQQIAGQPTPGFVR